jgi:aryl-alcohol dehydrogenase-like predicted oxidoreductase
VQYRILGGTGLKVSEISLGSWLSCDSLADKESSITIINRAYDLGINFFDTADCYSEGRAEIILGEALSKYPRESYVVATKVYWPTGYGPNDRGLSRKHILAQVDASLKRLGTEYIDLYYCHWYDVETPVEETMRAMDDLVRQGKVRYIGVSNWSAAQIAEALAVCERLLLHRIAANQPSYNIFDRYIEKESIPFCTRHGIGQVVYSPLAQGVLSGKYEPGTVYPQESRATNAGAGAAVSVRDYLNNEILKKVEQLRLVAVNLGITLTQLALAWVLRQTNVASALTGASRPTQVEENVKASGLLIPSDIAEQIEGMTKLSFTVKHNIIA